MKIQDITPQGTQIAVRKDSLVMQGDPLKQIEFARVAAKALMDVIESKPKKVKINGETYLEFEDWMMLARFWGATVGVEWTKPIINKDKVMGYEARAIVSLKGEVVSSAEAMCTRDERNWSTREEFMLRSMAQTRASAKALRNVFAWVATMAGYKGTPAEEMVGTSIDTPTIQIDDLPIKQQIMSLLIKLGRIPEKATKEEVETAVKLATDLPLASKNFPFIVERLKILNSEGV